MTDKEFEAVFDKSGRLLLPEKLIQEYGFAPGTEIFIEPTENGLRLRGQRAEDRWGAWPVNAEPVCEGSASKGSANAAGVV